MHGSSSLIRLTNSRAIAAPRLNPITSTLVSPLLICDLTARPKTRTLHFLENPHENSANLNLGVDLRRGPEGPHLSGSGYRGDAKCKFRYRPLRCSMDVSRTDVAQARANGETTNSAFPHHQRTALNRQGWLSLAPPAQELSSPQDGLPCVQGLDSERNLGGHP